jgi:hypothetical protein
MTLAAAMRSHAVACFPGNRTGARQPSTDRDTNRRTRVPEGAMGPPGPKEPARLSGGPQGLLGGGNAALGSPSTAPASCRFFLTDSRGSRVSGRNGACVRGWPAQNSAPRGRSAAELAARAEGAHKMPDVQGQDREKMLDYLATAFPERRSHLDNLCTVGKTAAQRSASMPLGVRELVR